MRILITGADGFVGKNLRVKLAESGQHEVVCLSRRHSLDDLRAGVSGTDFVFHLAGVNRPKDPSEFTEGNRGFTETLCRVLRDSGRMIPVAVTSSTQAELENDYGRSKRQAEDALLEYGKSTGSPVYLMRLTNVFGKWCRPNYNSAVATFCHNIANGLPIEIHAASSPLNLLYIDDLMSACLDLLSGSSPSGFIPTGPIYSTTVGEVADILRGFETSRRTLITPRVGTGLVRALYSTYISYLPSEAFGYQVARHSDPRGTFVEMLKTPDCGQFSYFTAHPGVTRGEHYHHSKTEKFLVIRGTARFGFRHIITGETHEIVSRGGEGLIVETVPGWTHNVVNVGDDELIVMLWANEIFDRNAPDTIALKVAP